MQNVFNCLDELKRFKEIPPNTIVIEERNGKTVTWQQIPSEQTDGYDTGANYLVSDQGDSYSIHRHSCMKNHDNGNGYFGINLRYGGETHRKSLSHTIWNTFAPQEERIYNWMEAGMQINHLDEKPANNSFSNLKPCTPKENCNYGHHNERISAANRGRQMSDAQRQHISEALKGIGAKAVVQLDAAGNVVDSYPSITDAAQKNGADSGNISAVCNGRRHTAGGYHWQFA